MTLAKQRTKLKRKLAQCVERVNNCRMKNGKLDPDALASGVKDIESCKAKFPEVHVPVDFVQDVDGNQRLQVGKAS